MRYLITVNQRLTAAVLLITSLLLGAPVSAVEQRTGTSLDHVQTGFPLLGAHDRTDCQTCHLQGIFKGTPRECVGCHTQGSRIASTFKSAGHPVTAMPCVQCHTSQVTWAGARFDHTGVAPGSCGTCHNGVTATGKPAKHVMTNAPCDQCHRTTAWTPASFDHTGVVPGTCTTCHGVTATGKPPGHMVTTAQCDQCHTTTAWTPANAFNHATAVAGQCTTCHGVTSTGKKNGHIPTALSCDACHAIPPQHFSFTTFAHLPGQGVVVGQCITCHNGNYTSSNAQGMNTTGYNHFPPMPGFTDCYNCHKSYTAFTSYTFDHASQGVVMSTATVCSTCHDGTHSFSGHLRGYQSEHNSLPHQGRCADSGCHTSFSSWSAGVGLTSKSKALTPVRRRK